MSSAGQAKRDRGPSKAAKPAGGRGSRTHRFFDANEGAWIVKVLPGGYYVSGNSDEVIATVLGSCVAACIRDPETGFGGLNHFMLPEEAGSGWGENSSMRYGTFAMEQLLGEMIKAGCPRDRLEIKLFGGSTLIGSSSSVGARNAEFVLSFLQTEGFKAAVEDLGGALARRINFYPHDGRVRRKLIQDSNAAELGTIEQQYKSSLRDASQTGAIELFK